MWQAKVVVCLVQGELLPHTVLPLAECVDTTPYCRHALPDVQVEPLDKGRLDLPATGRQYLLDGLQGPEHHAVAHADETPPAYGLDHLRIQQLGEGQPARLGVWPFVLAAWRLHPVPIVGEQGRQILP